MNLIITSVFLFCVILIILLLIKNKQLKNYVSKIKFYKCKTRYIGIYYFINGFINDYFSGGGAGKAPPSGMYYDQFKRILIIYSSSSNNYREFKDVQLNQCGIYEGIEVYNNEIDTTLSEEICLYEISEEEYNNRFK